MILCLCFRGNGTIRHSTGGGRADRTTKMLLVIVGVFLVTELPQGIMAVLSGMFSEEFRRYVYNNLGDILDLMALCNSCTTFVIYCTMSAQFRNVSLQQNPKPENQIISIFRNSGEFSCPLQ